MKMFKLGWKTITGAVVWGVGTLLQPGVLDILPDSVGKAVATVGAVLSAVGQRHAIQKKG